MDRVLVFLLLTVLLVPVQAVAHGNDSTHRLRTSQGGRYTGPLSPTGAETAYSADLHVHGSFSEGSGSMESYTTAGHDEGLDVVWWSDHDGFFTHYHMTTTFGFDQWAEAASIKESWIANNLEESNQKKSFELESVDAMAYTEAIITSEQIFEGTGSLKLSCCNILPDTRSMRYGFVSDKQRNKHALGSEVTVNIAVYPEEISAEASGIIEIRLSIHENESETAWEQYSLTYFLTDDTAAVSYRVGSDLFVPAFVTPGQWNQLALPLTDDAIAGFTWVTGIDNSLFQLNLGVESASGDTAVVFYDDLAMETTLQGEDVMAVQRVIMDSLEQRLPSLHQMQGVETNWHHLNIFGDDPALPDWDSIAVADGYMDGSGWISNLEDFKRDAAKAVVALAHAKGQAVSLNHMFGTNWNVSGGPDPHVILSDLLGSDVYGVDILEVGYASRGGQDLSAHMWVWDQLGREGYFLTGTGVTDSHSLAPGGWARREDRMISWLYSEEPTRPALVKSLQRGRVFFGDLTIFDGTVDLTSPHGFRMGQVVLTDRAGDEVTVTIDGLTAGDLLTTYINGTPINSYPVTGPVFLQTESVPIDSDIVFFRVGVTTSLGEPKVYSNPLYFIRQPAPGLTFHKAALDIGGYQSTLIDSFTVSAADTVKTPDRLYMTIAGTGTNGVIVLNTHDGLPPDSVRFDGLTGNWEILDTLLILSDLSGTGSAEISAPSPVDVDIPDQVVLRGVPFASISLDDFADDPGVEDSLLVWTATGGVIVQVSVGLNRSADISVTDNQWSGTEAIVFRAVDPSGFAGSDTVSFTVLPLADPPTLLEPPDGSTDLPTALTLRWMKQGDSTGYRLQFGTDSMFAALVVDDSTLADTSYALDSLQYNTSYYWRVSAHDSTGMGEWSARYSFRTIVTFPDTVVAISPADSVLIPADSASFFWNTASPEVDRYWFQIDTSESFPTAFVDSSLTDTSVVHGLLIDGERYYWTVRAHNNAGWGSFAPVRMFTVDIPPPPPATPVLLDPPDAAADQPTSLVLTWMSGAVSGRHGASGPAEESFMPGKNRNSEKGAAKKHLSVNNPIESMGMDSVTYHLQFSADSTLSAVLVEDSTLVDTSYALDLLEHGTTYYWRVSAHDITGTSGWSSRFSFRTIVAPPDTVVAISPADSALVQADFSSFTWNAASPEVDRYWFRIDTSEAFLTAFVDSSVTDTSLVHSALTDGERYYWTVRAHNNAGWGPFAAVRTFTVDIPPPPPATPVLLDPPDGATDLPTSLALTWTGGNPTARQSGRAPLHEAKTNGRKLIGSGKRLKVDDGPESMGPDSITYHLQLSTDSTLSTFVVNDSTLADTLYQVDSLAESSTFYWRVRSTAETGPSLWSDPWSFSTIMVSNPPPIPCEVLSTFIARCQPVGRIQMRLTLLNSTEYAGEIITFQVDTALISVALITNGTHSRAQVILRGQTTGQHIVSLANLPGCFDPVTVNCSQSASAGDDWLWDDGFEWGGEESLFGELPEANQLLDNYPNPFNPVTTIRYALRDDSQVNLAVYDLLGRKVKTIVDENQTAGYKSVDWHGDSDIGASLASGIYFYTLRVHAQDGSQFVDTRKLIILR